MAFIWNTDPNIPPLVPSPVIGPNEVSTQVHVVANTVNVHGLVVGSVSYNTANKGYDVIYELPSLNIQNVYARTLLARNASIGNAFINVATINTVTINTANITSATIFSGIMGVHPVQNLQIATKEYVDTRVANSIPLGGNLQLLIRSTGDLLAGVADNTAARFPISPTQRSILVAGNTSNAIGIQWKQPIPSGYAGTFRALSMGTDLDRSSRRTQVKIVSVAEIVMNDGQRISSGWNGLTASTTANGGPGFLDTGVVTPNTWYEVYAIRNSTTNTNALLLHRAVDRQLDVITNSGVDPLPSFERRVLFTATGSHPINVVNISQSFIATKSGPFVAVDVSLVRVGQPVGNCWITLQNNVNGNASGTPLSTSRRLDLTRLPISNMTFTLCRFIFDAKANVVSGNSYHCVYHVDHTPAGLASPHYSILRGFSNLIAGTYTSGESKNFSANTNSWEVSNSGAGYNSPVGPGDLYIKTYVEANDTPLSLPTGYDQRCLISYTCTDQFSQLKIYTQQQRRMVMPLLNEWRETSFGRGERTGDRYQIAVHLHQVVPPVVCIVQFSTTGWSVIALPGGIGQVSCTDVGGNGPSLGPLVHETEGVSYASAGVPGITTFVPVLVETQSVIVHLGVAANVYVTSVDF